jgi:hypothetical protein
LLDSTGSIRQTCAAIISLPFKEMVWYHMPSFFSSPLILFFRERNLNEADYLLLSNHGCVSCERRAGLGSAYFIL